MSRREKEETEQMGTKDIQRNITTGIQANNRIHDICSKNYTLYDYLRALNYIVT